MTEARCWNESRLQRPDTHGGTTSGVISSHRARGELLNSASVPVIAAMDGLSPPPSALSLEGPLTAGLVSVHTFQMRVDCAAVVHRDHWM
jgi:hypothetical protein